MKIVSGRCLLENESGILRKGSIPTDARASKQPTVDTPDGKSTTRNASKLLVQYKLKKLNSGFEPPTSSLLMRCSNQLS